MTTFNTGNPIGSTDARDRSDNSENLDLAVNSLSPTFVDRLGVTRDTLEGIYQKSAYYRAGTFDTGYTLTNNRQTLAYGNIEYSWSGAFPKVVAAGSTPATSGGVGSGAWVDRTQDTLRNELYVRRKARYVVYTDGQTIDELTIVATSEAITSVIAIYIPSPEGINAERELYLKNPSASTANIFFGSAVEDGTGSFEVTPGKCVHCISDGLHWIEI